MTGTESVLQAVASQLAELNEPDLHREIAELSLDQQELNRQLQERSFLQQAKGVQAQRQQERLAGQQFTPAARLDERTGVGRAIAQLQKAATEVSDHDLQLEISEIHQRIQALNVRLQQRQQALALKQMLGQQVTVSTDVGRVETDIEDKRQAVLELLQRDPSRAWSPAQVRKALTEQGVFEPDAGTPVRNLLWRLAKEGRIHSPRKGAYSMAPPPAPQPPES